MLPLHSLIVVFLLTSSAATMAGVHHELSVSLHPAMHRITVIDRITLPEGTGGSISFLLHSGLNPTVTDDGVKVQSIMPAGERSVPLEQITIELAPERRQFTLRYGGEIYHPIRQLNEEYARSFRVSPGLIAEEGVYLSGSSFWVPQFEAETMSFSMSVSLPSSWRSVSQGTRMGRTIQNDRVTEGWALDTPQEEIYLIAGVFAEYRDAAGAVEAMVFLRQPDPSLANKYLDATKQYIELYRKLIGPYPYRKFALVENFWETGYGMPSFTLLGPRVIRLPFILHSSYPHEILHNWWGNGVYVDYQRGNWAEGLTSYLADHLIKEQRGQGVAYRRQVLQKYTDYVRDQKDFPLTDFRSRHSAVTESVGYGKTLMLFHMLRQQLGDVIFIDALRQLFRRYRFKTISFDDVARVFEEVAGMPMAAFFAQWVQRMGAPSLRVHSTEVTADQSVYRLSTVIEQTQDAADYALSVPIVIHMHGEASAYQSKIQVSSKQHSFEVTLPALPVRLEVDPEFDVFRRLDRNEVPPALTQAFGAKRALIVLPAAAPESLRQGYQNLAQSWGQGRQIPLEVKTDHELTTLPDDRAVWLLGWNNRFRPVLSDALTDYAYTDGSDSIEIDGERFNRSQHSVVVVSRHPNNSDEALVWVATGNAAAIPGLSRKLPHYGKYSYLAFAGDEPANIAKGQWPVIHSPMSVVLPQPDGRPPPVITGKLAPRTPLIELPPVFSTQRMMQDLTNLAVPDMAGRGLGSQEIDRAAEYIADQFRAAGLEPGGALGGYLQTWTASVDELTSPVTLKNVIGRLPGTNPDYAGESVVLGAHYDHLGRGWPDVRRGNEGRVHPGADDNASGVAVMLELVRVLGATWRPERTVVFIAFTGEEAGKLGSRHYVQHAGAFAKDKIIGMLNLDTVGRLGDKPLLVLGSGSAREWVHIFRGAGFVTGVPIKSVAEEYGSSDHSSFLDQGVPAVQFFSGTHADYHRPGDTLDKIDVAGMVKVSLVVKEALEYLAARPEPLHVTLVRDDNTGGERRQSRRVLLGTVPDFTFEGPGVRLTGVLADSPAEEIGLRADDIIILINDTKIDHLRDLSNLLKSRQSGDRVTIHYVRGGVTQTATTTLVTR